MSINAAKRFLMEAMKNDSLRDSINSAVSGSDINAILQSKGLDFSYNEFDDAYRSTLVKCQFEEQAETLKVIKMWWDFICHSTPGMMV